MKAYLDANFARKILLNNTYIYIYVYVIVSIV